MREPEFKKPADENMLETAHKAGLWTKLVNWAKPLSRA